MAAITQVQIIVSAIDQATSVMGNIGNSVKNLANQAADNAAMVKQGGDLITAGIVAIGAAALASGVYSVKMASDFQASMTLIQTQAGASAKEVDIMSKAIMNLAPSVGASPKQLADALFYIESAGYRGSKALDILKLSAEGAAVGHSDLTKTANALTTVMTSGIKGVKDASDAMSVMNAIVGNGKMHMEDLISALSSGILPAARQVGLSIQDVGAALDVMTNNGIPAQEAASRLRMTLFLIESPTKQAAESLASVGLSSRQLADDMRKGGLIQAITDLNTHMNATQPASEAIVKGTKMTSSQLADLGHKILDANASLKILNESTVSGQKATDQHNKSIGDIQYNLSKYEAQLKGANTVIKTLGGSTLDAVGQAQLLTKAFGGARSGTTMELLVQQTDQLKARLQGVNSTSNAFAESWKKTQEDNAFATQKLGVTVQTLATTLGTALLPAVTNIENNISKNLIPAVTSSTGFIQKNKDLIIAVAGTITAVVLPAWLAYEAQIGIKNVLAMGKFIITEWQWIAANTVKLVQIALATAAWVVNNAIMLVSTATTIAMTAATWLLNAALAVLTSPITLVVLAIIALIAIGVLLITHWKEVQAVGGMVFGAVGGFFTALGKTVSGVVAQIIADIKNMVNTVIDHINSMINGVNGVGSKIGLGSIKIPTLQKLAGGGIVQGAIGEPVYVLAHGGERVIPAGLSSKGGGGTTNLIVNIGMYAGSDTEKRAIAKNLYTALVQMANSQHKNVKDYFNDKLLNIILKCA